MNIPTELGPWSMLMVTNQRRVDKCIPSLVQTAHRVDTLSVIESIDKKIIRTKDSVQM